MNFILPGVISMFCWGIAIFLAAIVSRKIGNVHTLLWMQIFGLFVGLVYFIPNARTLYSGQIVPALPIISVIAVLQLIAYLAFYKGLEKGQVSLVSPLGASWGLISALLGIVFYHEAFAFHQGLSIFLILAGIVGLSLDVKKFIDSKQVSVLAGVKEGVIAMFAWGISLFLLVTPTKTVNWFFPTLVFRLLLILFLGGYMIATKTSFVRSKVKVPWGTLFIIGAFDFAAFMSLSLGELQANSSLILPIASAYALVTVALAWIVLKEKMTPRHLISALVILAGIVGMSL
ncbi:DMT family transporter [Candidatus Gottesmanbacteria bacterium]|nr:DMT family transporter [Candidatus Gottesmanbacteria bacterium]